MFPTRFLDVGKLADSLDALHLFVPKNQAKGQWMALSYCWNDSHQMYRTTTKNFEEHLELIPFDKLPLTIQDAIQVTRSLNIRYL
jgi:hypothetical protein